jgi:pimeloyl-ACP methyl ester carboxylesterase
MDTRIDLCSADGTRLAARYWPVDPPVPGVVIVHGLHSRKENHADFAAVCQDGGMAALALDLRGHGASDGVLGPGAVDDIVVAVEALHARGHARIGLRGSSLGGLLALAAAARSPHVGCVVAICPARPEALAARLEEDWPLHLGLAEALGAGDGIARGYWHATGDERVSWSSTWALAQATPPPRQLRLIPGGTHSSLQHSARIQAQTREFLWQHLT